MGLDDDGRGAVFLERKHDMRFVHINKRTE